MTDMSQGPECETIKTYEVVTCVKVTDMTRGTIVGEGNWILFCNALVPCGVPMDTAKEFSAVGDVASWCHDAGWEFRKVSTEFLP